MPTTSATTAINVALPETMAFVSAPMRPRDGEDVSITDASILVSVGEREVVLPGLLCERNAAAGRATAARCTDRMSCAPIVSRRQYRVRFAQCARDEYSNDVGIASIAAHDPVQDP